MNYVKSLGKASFKKKITKPFRTWGTERRIRKVMTDAEDGRTKLHVDLGAPGKYLSYGIFHWVATDQKETAKEQQGCVKVVDV